MTRSSAIGVVLAIAVALPVSTLAEDIPARGPIPFSAYDRDDDGLISADEFAAARNERMETRAAQGQPMRGASFSAFDTNGDGQLTRAELSAGQQAHRGKSAKKNQGKHKNMPTFASYDLNRDGKIPEQEFNAARAQRISERAQQGHQMRNLAEAPAFSDIDANGDGEISAAEFAEHQTRHRPSSKR